MLGIFRGHIEWRDAILLTSDLAYQAARQPAAPALFWRNNCVSYAEVSRLADQAEISVAQLHDDGPVAIPAIKSPQVIALILACLRTGRAPLLTAPNMGSNAFDELVAQSGCAYIATVSDTNIQWRLANRHYGTPAVPDDTALLLTTSGSTGIPKIVPLAAAAVDRFTAWAAAHFDLGPGVPVLNYAPLNFDLSLFDLWATLRHGGTAAMVEPAHAVNPRYLLDIFARIELRVVQAVPMLFRILTDAVAVGRDATEFPSVRHILLTGDHTPRTLRTRLPGLFPNATFHNVYGCTETNDSFLHTFGAAEAISRETLPLGQPLPGVRAAVVGHELQVSTPFQTAGYLGGPSGKFVTRDGAVFFRTGDIVSRDARGDLTLVGRNDFQVKVRGVRVNLEEVERVLAEHDDVAEAAVVALPDAVAGVRLHALVRRTSGRLTGLRIREHCAAKLARAAIPSAIAFTTGPLPRTSTGKVDRSQIKADQSRSCNDDSQHD
jgi:acyl-coenzyme A synthetase/AMP-(fatty) acid ligase